MKNLLALFVLVSAAHALADAWSPKASAFQNKQAEERKKLGLDAEKAKKKFPTPEVAFGSGPGMAAWVCPGTPTQVLLEGKLAPGTLVGSMTEGVDIVKEEITPKGWLGTLNVKQGIKGRVTLQLIAPVSGISNTIEVPIGCPKEWIFDLKNGDRLTLKVIEGESRAAGEWSRGGKLIEARGFEFGSDGKTFTVAAQESAEDRERKKAVDEKSNAGDLSKRQADLSQKMQSCQTLPPAQMGPCIQKYAGEMQALVAAGTNAMEAMQQAAAPKVGCQQLTGSIEGKKLKGNGLNCTGPNGFEQMPLTGVIK